MASVDRLLKEKPLSLFLLWYVTIITSFPLGIRVRSQEIFELAQDSCLRLTENVQIALLIVYNCLKTYNNQWNTDKVVCFS